MGLLDDAIREHLELKRRQGADSNEIERLEGEAFGPASRPGEPDFPEPATGEEPLDEPATTLLDGPDTSEEAVAGAPFGVEEDWDQPAASEDPAPAAEAAPQAASDPEAEVAEDPLVEPAAGIFDIESTAIDLDDEQGPPESTADPEPIAEAEILPDDDADPLAGDAVIEEPAAEPDPTTISRLPEEDLVASLGQRPEPAAEPAIDPEPEDVEPELELQPDETMPADAAVDPVIEEPPPTTISPALGSAEPQAPGPVEDDLEVVEDFEEDDEVLEPDEVLDSPSDAPLGTEAPADDFADIELDADEDLEPPPAVDDPFATVEHPSARPDPPTDPGGPQETTESPTADDEEDVLEETPDFLRDQPEDDELWFEQGKPKDFDF